MASGHYAFKGGQFKEFVFSLGPLEEKMEFKLSPQQFIIYHNSIIYHAASFIAFSHDVKRHSPNIFCFTDAATF